MYQLNSKISFLSNSEFGKFETVADAVECAIHCGLPTEEFDIVRVSDQIKVGEIVAPDSKMYLLS